MNVLCFVMLSAETQNILGWILIIGVIAFGALLGYLYHKGILQEHGNGAGE